MHREKYEIDGITLYRGDYFEVLEKIPVGSVDMVLTDPPYGTTDCAWDVCPPWDKLFRELWRVLKKNGVICMFAQNPLAAEIIMQERRHYRHEWVWEKSQAAGFLTANRAPMRAHELILVFGRGAIIYNAIPIESQKQKPYYCGERGYIRTIYGIVGKACEKKIRRWIALSPGCGLRRLNLYIVQVASDTEAAAVVRDVDWAVYATGGDGAGLLRWKREHIEGCAVDGAAGDRY